jgi:hypothetical protein
MTPGFFIPADLCGSTPIPLWEQARSHRGSAVSCSLGVKIQHAHPSQQIRLRQIRMLMPTQRAIHQPVAVLNVEGETANEVLLFVALGDEVEAILVFGVQHDGIRVGFEGRQTGVSR